MMTGTDQADCPAFELLATAYHEAAHGVGAVPVSPQLIVESATIIPGDGYLGHVTFEDWSENIIPDPYDEDLGEEICEHQRQYMEAEDIVSYLGAMSEGMLRNGSPRDPAVRGSGFDSDRILMNAADLLDEDIFWKAGFYHGLRDCMCDDQALALIERTPYVWRAVGLVAGALMREKTLDGFEVEALVREARDRS
jgi:hypothetical protein